MSARSSSVLGGFVFGCHSGDADFICSEQWSACRWWFDSPLAKRISGWMICVWPFAVCVCFCLFLCYDLPTYMTTGVYIDVVLPCFFSATPEEKKKWFDSPLVRE